MVGGGAVEVGSSVVTGVVGGRDRILMSARPTGWSGKHLRSLLESTKHW